MVVPISNATGISYIEDPVTFKIIKWNGIQLVRIKQLAYWDCRRNMREYEVYVLESQKNGRFYIGSTQNLKNRIKRHNKNREKSTKGRGPWIIVFRKGFNSRSNAVKYEYYLKSLKSRKYISKIIKESIGGGSSAG